jgi:hypothetical protein
MPAQSDHIKYETDNRSNQHGFDFILSTDQQFTNHRASDGMNSRGIQLIATHPPGLILFISSRST